MDKIKQNLEKIVVWVGLVTAIGGGFTVYGEMNQKINSLEGLDLGPIQQQIAVLNKTVQILELEIKELKAASKNPLAN